MTAEPVPDPRAPAIFSYLIDVEAIPEGGLDVSIAADAATLQALAAADDLPGIGRLEADFHVVPKSLQRFNVTGEMRAKVTQICGVSLEPFDSDIVEPIDVDFAMPQDVRDAKAAHASGSHSTPKSAGVVVGEEPDPPDVIIDGRIDLGALACEFLALGLDPYPRKPGIVFEPPGNSEPEESDSPFRALRKLKDPS